MVSYQSENFKQSKSLYKDASSPVVFTDKNLSILWSNDMALSLFPSTKQADGLQLLFSAAQKEDLIKSFENGSSTFSHSTNFPLSSISFFFTPIKDTDDQYFVICHFVEKAIDSEINENLSSEISVKMREPLFNIFSSAKYLKGLISKSNIDNGLAFMDVITDNSYKILRTVNMIGLYSRFADGSSNLSPNVVNICSFIYELCDAISFHTKLTEIPFTYSIPEKGIHANISEEKLSTAILNIIYNSFIYTKPDNHISLTLVENKSFVTITIKDNGIGMTKQQLSDVFLPLSSFSDSNMITPSVGLGLTLSKMIINEHGGTIAVSSAPESGTTIAFNIPILDMEPKSITLSQTPTNYISDHFSPIYVNLIGFQR